MDNEMKLIEKKIKAVIDGGSIYKYATLRFKNKDDIMIREGHHNKLKELKNPDLIEVGFVEWSYDMYGDKY